MDTLKSFARGEPVVVGQVVVMLFAAIGMKIDSGTAGQLGVLVLTGLVTWFGQRAHATPAANPAIPLSTVDPKTGVAGSVEVITFAGKRP